MQRRDFLHLAGLGGGAIFSASLAGCAGAARQPSDEFYFVQL